MNFKQLATIVSTTAFANAAITGAVCRGEGKLQRLEMSTHAFKTNRKIDMIEEEFRGAMFRFYGAIESIGIATRNIERKLEGSGPEEKCQPAGVPFDQKQQTGDHQ